MRQHSNIITAYIIMGLLIVLVGIIQSWSMALAILNLCLISASNCGCRTNPLHVNTSAAIERVKSSGVEPIPPKENKTLLSSALTSL